MTDWQRCEIGSEWAATVATGAGFIATGGPFIFEVTSTQIHKQELEALYDVDGERN